MLKGTIKIKGDKSISHRVLILASLSNEQCIIKNLSICKDVERTIDILKSCGIQITKNKNTISILGGKFKSTQKRFYCGNSGSTARFMLGLLPTKGISGTLYGDQSLSKRPMKRIIDPLKKMGIQIASKTGTLPIIFKASSPIACDHTLKIPSAQVKTTLIFSSLSCSKRSSIKDTFNTRDHTERLIYHLGYKNKKYSSFIPRGFKYTVAGDISNASFLISAALLIPGSKLTINNILYNKTRIGYINILKLMGANITVFNKKNEHNETICNLKVHYTPLLKSIKLSMNNVVSMIDEIPIFALVASYANGKTQISGANELRYKESDRIHSIVYNLEKMNANIKEDKDGFTIKGPNILYDTTIKTFSDHRIALMGQIAKLIFNKKVVRDSKIEPLMNTSFPGFYDLLEEIYV